MSYRDLRDFIAGLERDGQLKRIGVEVDPKLEMTEICDRVLKQGGPALLFEKPKGYNMPVLGNLFKSNNRGRKKSNLMVFLRPVVLRDARATQSLSADRYELMRAIQQNAQPEPSRATPINEAPVLPALPPQPAAPQAPAPRACRGRVRCRRS